MTLTLKNKNHDILDTIYSHRLSKTSEHQTLTLKHNSSIKSQLFLSEMVGAYEIKFKQILFRLTRGFNLKVIKSLYQRIIKWVSPKQNIRLLISNLKERN